MLFELTFCFKELISVFELENLNKREAKKSLL